MTPSEFNDVCRSLRSESCNEPQPLGLLWCGLVSKWGKTIEAGADLDTLGDIAAHVSAICDHVEVDFDDMHSFAEEAASRSGQRVDGRAVDIVGFLGRGADQISKVWCNDSRSDLVAALTVLQVIWLETVRSLDSAPSLVFERTRQGWVR